MQSHLRGADIDLSKTVHVCYVWHAAGCVVVRWLGSSFAVSTSCLPGRHSQTGFAKGIEICGRKDPISKFHDSSKGRSSHPPICSGDPEVPLDKEIGLSADLLSVISNVELPWDGPQYPPNCSLPNAHHFIVQASTCQGNSFANTNKLSGLGGGDSLHCSCMMTCNSRDAGCPNGCMQMEHHLVLPSLKVNLAEASVNMFRDPAGASRALP